MTRVTECAPVKAGTQIGTQMNTNGTQMERIDERVPDAFQKRFLLGYF